jgi:hypothetical protein
VAVGHGFNQSRTRFQGAMLAALGKHAFFGSRVEGTCFPKAGSMAPSERTGVERRFARRFGRQCGKRDRAEPARGLVEELAAGGGRREVVVTVGAFGSISHERHFCVPCLRIQASTAPSVDCQRASLVRSHSARTTASHAHGLHGAGLQDSDRTCSKKVH